MYNDSVNLKQIQMKQVNISTNMSLLLHKQSKVILL